MIRINQVKLPLLWNEGTLRKKAAELLRVRDGEILSVRVVRRAVDARDKGNVHFSVNIDVELKNESIRLPKGAAVLTPKKELEKPVSNLANRPVVVGFGPAGMFAALRLAEAGARPIVLERGRAVDERTRDVETFWNGGAFCPQSNVQFGEGGAGTFSDGKLTTGIKHPYCADVLETLYEMGAPEDILISAKPHIGTDRLKIVVKNIRERVIALGGEVRFSSLVEKLLVEDGRVSALRVKSDDGTYELPAEQVIFAIGHSARDTFQMLRDEGVGMEKKPFAIGARIEHRQNVIDRSQYGKAAGHPALSAADYKLSTHLPDGRGAYTFCMCPGGQVVAAASEDGMIAVNGMSSLARDGENANSALLVSVTPEDFGDGDVLSGVRFQQKWERLAYESGGGNWRAPAQLVGDFLAKQPSSGTGDVNPSYLPGVVWGRLDDCLPGYVAEDMRLAIREFDWQIKGFAGRGAVLTGVETRSSSPVRILRGESYESNISGLYPSGEGAGYAGGIVSAAVDGMRSADAVLRNGGVK